MKSRHSFPLPFIAMTDMLISLNAGLLILGIVSAVDPKHESDWRRLQAEIVRIEQEAADFHRRTFALQQRHQLFLEETKVKTPAPADGNSDQKEALARTATGPHATQLNAQSRP